MRVKITALLVFLCTSVLLISCQKEVSVELGTGNGNGNGGGGNNNNSIEGDYDYVGVHAVTLSTVTFTILGEETKSVTTSDYYGKNCTGTVKITANQFISTNVAYDIDTTMNVKMYTNGVLTDDEDFPFTASVPPTGGTSTYVKNSADSITVTGSFGSSPNPSGNNPTGPIGARLSWSGDTLIMKTSASFTQNISQGGIPAVFVGKVSAVTKLKKR
ncbi:MAG: hypothetical protein JNK14_00120 [Chitinophagaceae bacterium]|nr:hypothetical protein [Chitinophagaceae bacterium]